MAKPPQELQEQFERLMGEIRRQWNSPARTDDRREEILNSLDLATEVALFV